VITVVKLGKNMRSVSIVGVGCTPFKDFESHPETQGIGEGEAFGYAALEAIADAGLEPRDIQYFFHGAANPYLVGDCITPNMQVADWFGVRSIGSVHHSEACCTGYVALEEAVMAVASGAYDVVLSGAVDLASTLPVEHKPSCFRQDFPLSVMIPSLDKIYDRAYGRPLDGAFGVSFDNWINEYAMTYDLTAEQIDDALNGITKSTRRGAAVNPLAWYDQTVAEEAKANGFDDEDAYLKSQFNPKVTQYLRVTGFEKKCDGAAAIVVMPTEMAVARGLDHKPVEVLGTGASAVEAGLKHNEHWATETAAKQVYELTGVSPDEIDLFMCNDFFLASEIVASEECGYIPRGEAWQYAIDGRTAYDGDKPINPHGGRCSFGHAHGASGIADICDAVWQMRGEAGAHQVAKVPQTTFLRGFGGSQNVRCQILRTVD
jgi:acetyl-CoA C-acetyltransferase